MSSRSKVCKAFELYWTRCQFRYHRQGLAEDMLLQDAFLAPLQMSSLVGRGQVPAAYVAMKGTKGKGWGVGRGG